MSDVRDILGLSSPKDVKEEQPSVSRLLKRRRSEGAKATDVKAPPKKKRKTGLAREVAALTSEMPSLAPAIEFKEKPKLVKQRVDAWVNRPFRNSARKDGVLYSHWIKAKEIESDYAFAKYSRPPHLLKFTSAQYVQFLDTKKNGWTEAETAYLLEMCEKYDLRFIVIQDRWNFATGTPRTVEDIKDRYYEVQKALLEQIINKNDPGWEKHPMIKNKYNKEQEVKRKRQLEQLLNRTAEQEEEEEELLPLSQSLQQAFKNHRIEANKLLKEGQKCLKRKKASLSRSRGRQSRGGRERDDGVTPRSGVNKEALARLKRWDEQVNLGLLELGVAKPSSAVVRTRHSELKADLCLLFELQRIQAEALYELQVLKEQKALLTGNGADTHISLDELQQQTTKEQVPITMIPIKPHKALEYEVGEEPEDEGDEDEEEEEAEEEEDDDLPSEDEDYMG